MPAPPVTDAGPPDPKPPAPAPAPQVVPDDDIPVDEDLEEELPDENVREIVIDASALGKANAIDVFTHAGGRTVVSKEETRERGATSVGEALERKPGVRTTEGNSGLGSQDTKLQVAVRGVNPRLSSRATVLLDEIPIAPAPYGQPQLSLFPLSLFSISSIDVVRGGATARYGPQTSGGVFNLESNPIPEHPSISVFAQGDSNLDFSLGGAYGATHGRFGMYLEYAPRFGSSWREHSDKLVHGGLGKLAWQFTPGIRLESISHGYFEASDLPGGLSRAAYDEDPFQSTRPFDWFRGMRAGTALKFSARIGERQDLKINAWYNHSYRDTYLASNAGTSLSVIDDFQQRPRTYNVMGLEPRWTMRLDAKERDFSQQISVGLRAAYELANMRTVKIQFATPDLNQDDDAKVGAYAGYVNEKLIFLGGDMYLDLGLRLEFIQVALRDNILLDEYTELLEGLGPGEPAPTLTPGTILERGYWAPLPAASFWYAPIDQLALFTAYGRSFGPPQYLQIGVAGDQSQLDPEITDSVELGLKILELGGIEAETTAWYKEFNNYIDVGLEDFDVIPRIRLWGIESELAWYPSEIWDGIGEPEVYAGYGWTESYLTGSGFTGNDMPWYPKHEAWAGAAYGFDFGLTFGADFAYTGRQYTDYQNREMEDLDTAAYGPIPAYATLNLWARMIAPLPTGWRLEFTGGIKNVSDTRYFSRTDDRNAGILVGRPRTFYLNLGFAHDFLPKHLRAPKKGKRGKKAKAAGRTTHRADQRAFNAALGI